MEEVKFRYATNADIEVLSELAKTTFWDAYQTDSHIEQKHIKDYISKAFTPTVLESEIEDRNTVFIIAEQNKNRVGYAKLILESTRPELTENKPIEISRIYLDKNYWGKRIGSVLLQQCLDEGMRNPCDVIWLSVWEHNLRAIKFYEKFGFEKISTHVFDLASSLQTDFLMRRHLR